jgi:hypothetical protein
VEKPTGNIYLGQGLDINGFRVVRINTNGSYDNYITTADVNFAENWKMYWSCNNGTPQILIFGGGTTSNVNIATLTPPSTTLTSINITGIPFIPPPASGSGNAQDIVDAVIDPNTKELFSLFTSQNGTPVLNNKIYKNSAPYSAASIVWNVPSGFNTMSELDNRPYLLTNYIFGDLTDNSANMLALNPNYLFYWDGKNLKAFNKATGAGVGTPLITSNIAKMSGGILADPFNNIYIGNVNGTISSYTFTGTTFIANGTGGDPFFPQDISITGYSTKSVYDLIFNEADNKIYACGDGFVASYNSQAFTSNVTYALNIVPNCATASATAALNPMQPIGTVVTYTLYNGSTLITSNNTGLFTGLAPLTTYTIKATLNAACSGVQIAKDFVLPGPTIDNTLTDEICGNSHK